jgi:hypothetical protein
MKTKGIVIGLACLFLAAFGSGKAQSYGVTDDLWDIHRGTVITFTTGVLGSTTDPGMFGGSDGGTITTHFSDSKPDGYVHVMEWRTTNTVQVNRVKLYAVGDGAVYNNQREFARFTLKIKSPGSSTFDTTVLNFIPTHPYTLIGDKFLLDQTFATISAQEFHAEFQQINLGTQNGPRVIELDAFGPPPSDPARIVQPPAAKSVFIGESASFSASVSGTDPITIQWQHENTNVVNSARISGATGTQLTIQNVTPDDAGSYTVKATNAFGNAASSATLTVLTDSAPPNVTLAFTNPPSVFDRSVALSGSVADNNRVSGVVLFRNDELLGGLALTTGIYITNAPLVVGENRLKVVAADPAGNTNFAEAVFTVQADTNAPVITLAAPVLSGPYEQSVALHGSVSDNHNVSSFRWERNGQAMGSLPFASNAFSVTVSLVVGENRLKLIATDPTGNSGSVETIITVQPDTTAPVVAISQPIAGSVSSKFATLQGTVSDNYSLASARWEKNGVNQGNIAIVGGAFNVSIQLDPGSNVIKVIGKDTAGNEGSAQVIVSWDALTPSANDLWDLTAGTVVTGTSGFLGETTVGMLGGSGYSSEPGSTIFTSRTNGFVHTVDWKTLTPVTVNSIRLFATGDSGGDFRSFASFTLKAKSSGSTNFDLTILTFAPSQPIPFLDVETFLILATNITAFTAQEFRAEFVQLNAGPRIVELDGFGPQSSAPPSIATQPADRSGYIGGNAQFTVGASGARPLMYQWKHNGTNLLASTHYSGVSALALTVANLTTNDVGNYSVFISNQYGQTNSVDAALTVDVDTNAPVITIVSPAAGTNNEQSFTLSGSITDNDQVTSASWYRNGILAGPLNLLAGQFIVPGQLFNAGDNQLKIVAADRSGNRSTNEVTVSWSPARALQLIAPAPQQEGGLITVPVSLVSTGGVSGATFAVGFDTNYLADPHFEWADSGDLGLMSVNIESNKVFRASFAVAGSSVSAGARTIANMTFRTRSVQTNRNVNFTVTLVGMYSETGDPFTTGNYIQGTSALITKRKITGDNNANDRLDVGDATVILRLVTGVDLPRAWDAAANDLNNTKTVDSGDVIKVLRAVVGLDPQPSLPTNAQSFARSLNLAAAPLASAGGPIVLVADKTTAIAGEKVTVEVRLTNQVKSLTGISFRMEYPADALKLENATSQQLGAAVPTGASAFWNVAPDGNNYVTQNGAVSMAASAATVWPSSNGVIARLTFTVQPGATNRYGWAMAVKNVEVSRADFLIDSLAGASWTFVARAPVAAQFAGGITFNGQTPRLSLQGDIGATYLIEGSSDLQAWDVVGLYYNSTGTLVVEDSLAGGATARFYRATLQQ